MLRIVYGGVFDRHPEAKLIIAHLGEMLPFFAWRIQRAFEYNPYSQRTRKRLQDYLSDNIWVTTSGNFRDQALIYHPARGRFRSHHVRQRLSL